MPARDQNGSAEPPLEPVSGVFGVSTFCVEPCGTVLSPTGLSCALS